MCIFSPMARGNGAYVIHNILAEKMPGYRISGYNPYWTLFPPALPLICKNRKKASLTHTTPDYGWLFRKKGIPLVVTFHNYVLDPFMNGYSSLPQRVHYTLDLRLFTKLAVQRANIITSVSRFTAKMVKEDLGCTKNIEVIYNGIDTDFFRPTTGNSNKKIKVLFSGNITRRKGADLLPLIAQRLDKNIEILYTSGLRTKNRLPSIPNMRNIGSMPHSQMPQIYQDADILLFPTVREGFGLAAAEAMACGLPVVATDCSSLPELIEHGRGGYLCDLGNVDAFAAHINELAGLPGLRREMGEFNRNRVEEKFTVDRMVRQYKKLFERVAA